MSKKKQRAQSQAESPDELLGDLESIRELLDEDEAVAEFENLAPARAESSAGDDQVPLLDDVVDGALQVDEARIGLDDDMFQALLGDGWKKSAGEILSGAREAIEAHRNEWAPEDTDELSEALRIRIDETLNQWLNATLRQHVGELQAQLLDAAQQVIDEQIESVLSASVNDTETPRR